MIGGCILTFRDSFELDGAISHPSEEEEASPWGAKECREGACQCGHGSQGTELMSAVPSVGCLTADESCAFWGPRLGSQMGL